MDIKVDLFIIEEAKSIDPRTVSVNCIVKLGMMHQLYHELLIIRCPLDRLAYLQFASAMARASASRSKPIVDPAPMMVAPIAKTPQPQPAATDDCIEEVCKCRNRAR